jgi:MFS family permease
MLMFVIGSQFFYALPFYQMYPALSTIDKDGNLKPITREKACELDRSQFQIDWDQEDSLHNWMTKLDIICEEPYKVGLIGSFSFVGFSLGSLFISRLSDKYGRRSMLLGVNMIIIILLFLCIIATSLLQVYCLILVMGLTYNCRANTAYIFATEFIHKKNHMTFAIWIFILFGTIQFLTGFYFLHFKDQTTFVFIIIVVLTLCNVWVAVVAKESPHFLLEKNKIDQLHDCIGRVAWMNGFEVTKEVT